MGDYASDDDVFGRDEVERQTDEIRRDKENLHVRRVSVFTGCLVARDIRRVNLFVLVMQC